MDLISCIDIKSFRGIKSLKLENLAQINVLTGDNNCGKTSVLELLESFERPEDFHMWRSLIRREIRIGPGWGISYYEGFCDLFNVDAEEKKIEYTIDWGEEKTNVLLLGTDTEEEITEERYYELQGISAVRDEREENLIESTQIVPKLELEIIIDGQLVNKDILYEGQRRYLPEKNFYSKRNSKQIIYISPIRHAEGNIFLDRVLNDPDLYEEMLLVLREFDENIVSINYSDDDSSRSGRGVYKILSKSHRKALPLNMYGDGMKKAVLLMSAVIRAKDGVLLLDEFETAIHTSAMNKVFKWILETCKKLNVQLFLTSHSKEAIDKILKCAPDIRKDIAVYTLYKEEKMTSVRRLTGDKAIEVQDEMGLELR